MSLYFLLLQIFFYFLSWSRFQYSHMYVLVSVSISVKILVLVDHYLTPIMSTERFIDLDKLNLLMVVWLKT